jgi:hypothetical protein
MEIVEIGASESADVAKSTTDNVALNVVSALANVALGKGENGLSDKNARLFASMRNKLFIKYIGADYEVLLPSVSRNDRYLPAIQ